MPSVIFPQTTFFQKQCISQTFYKQANTANTSLNISFSGVIMLVIVYSSVRGLYLSRSSLVPVIHEPLMVSSQKFDNR